MNLPSRRRTAPNWPTLLRAGCDAAAPREARDRHMVGQSLRGLRYIVRGQELRCAFGRVSNTSGTLVPRCDLRASGFHTLSGRFPQREGLALDRHGTALDRISDHKAWDIFERIDSVFHTIDYR